MMTRNAVLQILSLAEGMSKEHQRILGDKIEKLGDVLIDTEKVLEMYAEIK